MQTSELKPTQKLVLSRVCRMCCCSGCLNATDIFEQTARQLQWRKVKVMHRRPYSTVTFDEKKYSNILQGEGFELSNSDTQRKHSTKLELQLEQRHQSCCS